MHDTLGQLRERMLTLGVPDGDFDQLVRVAQDIELASVCQLFHYIHDIGHGRLPPQVLDLLRILRETLQSRAHRLARS